MALGHDGRQSGSEKQGELCIENFLETRPDERIRTKLWIDLIKVLARTGVCGIREDVAEGEAFQPVRPIF